MSFSRAIIYPEIEIQDEEWIKNSVLFWDELNTIVPGSLDAYYKTDISKLLYEEEILKPIFVFEESQVVKNASNKLINESPKVIDYQIPFEVSYNYGDQEIIHLHHDKYSKELKHFLNFPNHYDYAWTSLPYNLGFKYMTYLADEISIEYGISKLTNNKYMYGPHYCNIYNLKVCSKEAYMLNLIFENINIDKDTPTTEIIKFKRKHKDELGRFRTAISNLLLPIDDSLPLEAHKQKIYDIYINEYIPSLKEFEKSLDSFNIKWLSENVMKIATLSVASTSLPVVLGLDTPIALLAAGTLSLTCTAANMYAKRQELLTSSPFSYYMSVNNHFDL